jgi:hypothetical protein
LKQAVIFTHPFKSKLLLAAHLVTNLMLLVLTICVLILHSNDELMNQWFSQLTKEKAFGELMILLLVILMVYNIIMQLISIISAIM